MKIYKIIACSLVIVTGLMSCVLIKPVAESGSAITVLPLGDTVQITEGSLVYALPMTVLHFTVTVEHEFEKPGPYARYAGQLLGLKDVINEESESWTIKNIDIKTSQELDPSEFYVIESNTLMQTNALSLKREGLILDINPELYNKVDSRSIAGQSDFQGFSFSDLGANEYYEVARDTSYRIIELDTAFIKIPYLVEMKKQLTIDQLAENAAKTLIELRDGRQMILTGEANVYPQGSAAIIEMNRLESEYLALFNGKTWKEKKTYVYDVIPDKKMISAPVVLFKFSDVTGILSPSASGGVPLTIGFVPSLKTQDLVVVSRPESNNNSGKDTVKKYDKLYYRVPDVATINVSSNKEVITSTRKLIYQFGNVITLPANYIIGN